MMPQFSKADLNKFWHGVQNEVALICAKFGKDLFSISKVIGRKTKQSGPGFFGLPGRSPHRHIPRIKGMHRNNTQSKWDRRRVRSLSWFTSSWKLIINRATTVLFRGERTTHVFTTVADRSITRVNVYATLIHCLPLRPIKLSTSFSLSAFLPCFYRTFFTACRLLCFYSRLPTRQCGRPVYFTAVIFFHSSKPDFGRPARHLAEILRADRKCRRNLRTPVLKGRYQRSIKNELKTEGIRDILKFTQMIFIFVFINPKFLQIFSS